jgi:hypothetical protein
MVGYALLNKAVDDQIMTPVMNEYFWKVLS